MTPSELSPEELTVYATAFGAEFARSLAYQQAIHSVAMEEPIAVSETDDSDARRERSAVELRIAKEEAVYVAREAVIAFRDIQREWSRPSNTADRE